MLVEDAADLDRPLGEGLPVLADQQDVGSARRLDDRGLAHDQHRAHLVRELHRAGLLRRQRRRVMMRNRTSARGVVPGLGRLVDASDLDARRLGVREFVDGKNRPPRFGIEQRDLVTIEQRRPTSRLSAQAGARISRAISNIVPKPSSSKCRISAPAERERRWRAIAVGLRATLGRSRRRQRPRAFGSSGMRQIGQSPGDCGRHLRVHRADVNEASRRDGWSRRRVTANAAITAPAAAPAAGPEGENGDRQSRDGRAWEAPFKRWKAGPATSRAPGPGATSTGSRGCYSDPAATGPAARTPGSAGGSPFVAWCWTAAPGRRGP